MHEKNERGKKYNGVSKKPFFRKLILLPWFESSGPPPLWPIESNANETTFVFEPLVVLKKKEKK